MAKVQSDLSNIEDLLGVIKAERNLFTRQELKILNKEQPGTFDDNDVLKVGARVFKDFEPKDLELIEKAYQNYSIIDLSGGQVGEAAAFAYTYINKLAQKHRRSGLYSRSILMFARSIGGTDKQTTLTSVKNNRLPDRPVVSIVADTAYATRLEGLVHHGINSGFLYHTSKVLKREFGASISVKFDFLQGTRLGYQGGTLPRLQIGQVGSVRGRSRIPAKWGKSNV